MQSPYLKEASQVCLCSHGGCCPFPFFSSHEPLNKVCKSRSTSADCRRDFAATTASSIFPETQFTNHESLPSLQQSFNEFTNAYPQYFDTSQVDQIRAKEYHHLSLSNHTCLDYFGIGLFSYSQLQKQESSRYQMESSSQSLDIPIFSVSYKTGNLKTQLLHGGQESELESAMKKRIMDFMNISENDYSMVLTANRTSAFKLLAESYPFKSSKKLLTVYDYESEAVEAMINTSEKRGARVMSAEFSWPGLRINSAKLRKIVVNKRKNEKQMGLFVFPFHSRMTGARYPYQWMRIAQENGWHILVDACALGPKDMNSFGLSLFRPDFLICSFYKIFGEDPSGFGCLFVKKSTVPNLGDDTSSGMVSLLPAKKQLWLMEDFSSSETEPEQTSKLKQQHKEVAAASNTFLGPMLIEMKQPSKLEKEEIFEVTEKPWESGKAAECRGLDQVDSLGMTMISRRARCLINWLVNALMKLQHPNTEGVALIKIYGPKIKFDRGPALAFNVFDWKGEKIEPVLVQKLADRKNISLSYGFLHQICFKDKYQREKDKVLETRGGDANSKTDNKTYQREKDKVLETRGGDANSKTDNKTNLGINVVTASLGFLANFEDIYRLWAFVAQFLDADFLEKARWRYTALNQKTIEV